MIIDEIAEIIDKLDRNSLAMPSKQAAQEIIHLFNKNAVIGLYEIVAKQGNDIEHLRQSLYDLEEMISKKDAENVRLQDMLLSGYEIANKP